MMAGALGVGGRKKKLLTMAAYMHVGGPRERLDGWMGGWLPAHATPPIPTPTRSRFMKQAVLGAERAATGVAVYRGVSRGAIALAPRPLNAPFSLYEK